MCIGGTKLRLVLSCFSFKGEASNPIWVIQWNLLTFQCDVGLSHVVNVFMVCKERLDLCMNRVHCWIAYFEIGQPENSEKF